ncbi:Zinc finger protein ZFAT [Tupaia chinensis]|uniref:Zinc finger protein ZFAT n=1 Tax=Tupaia chinensis TaxID=246437 RepID=L9K6S8_TUPCH|nr:Zinc finger protein ZFAT [Tupaia chinensis]
MGIIANWNLALPGIFQGNYRGGPGMEFRRSPALVGTPRTLNPSSMTVTDEEPSSNHTVMIQETLQQASVELAEQHHLVVSSDDVEGIETVTVYTQGGEASEFIVYVQEAMQPVEEQAVEQPAQEI